MARRCLWRVWPDTALTAKAEATTFPSDTAFDRQAERVTLRRQLFARKGWAIGAGAGPVYRSPSTGRFTCDGAGAEIRAVAGYSGARKGRPFHAFADRAVIAREAGCRRTRAEFSYGADLGHSLLTGQPVWLEDGSQSAEPLKTETQPGYSFKHFDAAIGSREEIGGVFDERAVLVAITARRQRNSPDRRKPSKAPLDGFWRVGAYSAGAPDPVSTIR